MGADHLAVVAGEIRELLIERRRAAIVAGKPTGEMASAIREAVEERAAVLSEEGRNRLAERVLRDTVGLGPLEVLMADPSVEEILVNRHDVVYVERAGVLAPAGIGFDDEEHLRDVIERILAPIGRRVDELSPIADGRLADGSRVNVVIPPLAVEGPLLSIRRFGAVRPGPAELIRLGSIPGEVMDTLKGAVAAGRNILISGGTGSGKTTVLNALSSFIGVAERVVTIEDAAELRLAQEHVVRLETRPPGVEGSGEVTIRDLVRNALRMRPDRLVIGEVRGAEAMDLLVALNTGHRGALSTIHANGPEDALVRLETLALMAALGLPHSVIRRQIGAAFDLVLHLERGPEGRRQATCLASVEARENEIATAELWSR